MKIAQRYLNTLSAGQDIKFEKTAPFIKTVNDLIKWVHGDEGELDLYKSIGLIGPTGNRKTFLITCLNEYMKIDNVQYLKHGRKRDFTFRIVSAREIVKQYNEKGAEALDHWSFIDIICIDDMGSEPNEALYYGNRINVIENIIEERYYHNKITHFTSNLRPDDFRSYYSERVYSRIMQTTNIILLLDKDFRLI